MNIGIIGHGSEKFTERTSFLARQCIRQIIQLAQMDGPVTVVSGHSPMGGIDIWCEEIGKELGAELLIFPPEKHEWNPIDGIGFKQRNIQIAKASDIVHVIAVKDYPPDFPSKLKFKSCYHCLPHKDANVPPHVKGGACWTAWLAKKMGKEAVWHIITSAQGDPPF